MEKTKQGLIWQIICIVVCVLFIPIIVFNLILTIQGSANPDKLPSLFGYSPTAVMTGSMSPEFEANDLIFIKSVDTDNLKAEEDVICFIDKNGDYVTHRISRIEEVNGIKQFYTKGDANNAEDRGFILAEQIQGKYVGKIANFGGIVMFVQSPYGLMLTVILLVMLYIAGELLVEYIEKKKENIKLTDENEALKAENERLKGLNK